MTSENKSKPQKLVDVAKDFNIGKNTLLDFLVSKGLTIKDDPNARVPLEYMDMVFEKFKGEKAANDAATKETERAKESKENKQNIEKQQRQEAERQKLEAERQQKEQQLKEQQLKEQQQREEQERELQRIEAEKIAEQKRLEAEAEKVEVVESEKTEEQASGIGVKVLGSVDLDKINQRTRPTPKSQEEKDEERRQAKAAQKAKKDEAKNAQKPAIKGEAKAEPKPQQPNDKKVIAPANVLPKPKNDPKKEEKPQIEHVETRVEQLQGPTVVGKIDLSSYDRQKENEEKRRQEEEKRKQEEKKRRQEEKEKMKSERKEKRKRISKSNVKVDVEKVSSNNGSNRFSQSKPQNDDNSHGNKKPGKKGDKNFKKGSKLDREEEREIIRTINEVNSKKGSKFKEGQKKRKEERESLNRRKEEEAERQSMERRIIKVTEFVTVSELTTLMNNAADEYDKKIGVNDIIGTCMSLGRMVSINQRLDAELMEIVAEEFGYKIEFVSAEILDEIKEVEDREEDLQSRPPIVTVMGHVDHGKTKLLDYIRHTNVVAGEAGGITQHIGAYSVTIGDKKITFLDTPGHEAFTAMRARGAQITDVAIIVIAADDDIMPQTREAISHASAANVPIVFAINKIDKPTANPDKIKANLANMNYLVEELGGEYQSQDISAKAGLHVEELLEKVLLQAELLDLKANPDKNASGTVIESSLDKGRGYVATLIVQSGTLKVGDILLAGCATGRVKAMFNERNQKVKEAGPSTPVLVLGLDGAPQAGDKFNVLDSDQEARSLANKRSQLQRELSIRTQKHITLGEIGRRMALGDFHEINIIIKGDVDGSVEALSDQLIKLSTSSFAVNIMHKAVGQISESDVMLAAASDAMIVGFQVRPSVAARKMAEKEGIEIRLYSIIFEALNEVKAAMEGMLKPVVKEIIIGSAEIREVFKISKVGSVAGCLITDGRVTRKSKVRLIRDGIVVYSGELGSLKRFKDDAKEVIAGQECGLNIDRFNDIKTGDVLEFFEETEEKATLS